MNESIELVTIKTIDGDMQVEAIVRGCFAIHPTIVGAGSFKTRELALYTVTHIPTGLALMHKLEELNDARAFIAELSALKVDWENSTEAVTGENYKRYMTKTTYKKIGTILRHYRKHIALAVF